MANDDVSIDDNENDIFLSDHSRSMQNAFHYCIKLFHRLEATNSIAFADTAVDANRHKFNLRSIFQQGRPDIESLRRTSKEHRNRRRAAHRAVWLSASSSTQRPSPASGDDFSTNSVPCTVFSDKIRAKNQIQLETIQLRIAHDENSDSYYDYNYDHDNNKDIVQSICPEQVRYFKDRFQNLNVPCLINGLDRSPHFRFVNDHWRSRQNNVPKNSGINSSSDSLPPSKASSKCKIHRNWFRDELGDDCLVPLRYTTGSHGDGGSGGERDDSGAKSSLDEDGRAMECETKEVRMKEWIHMLEASSQPKPLVGEDTNDRCREHLHPLCNDPGTGALSSEEVQEPNPIYYLKDWHLQQRYSSAVTEQEPHYKDLSASTTRHDKDSFKQSCNWDYDCPLYSTPEFFGCDLLNSFMTRFTTGDYRFCYWGPSRSFTARHSDVLHSFSWSYNVVGTKEWTFYWSDPPCNNNIIGNNNKDDSNEDAIGDDVYHASSSNRKTFTIVQETGQTIFVPATWQHKVVNLEETISINHNWITSSNLDLVWDCLTVEMVAIRNELKGWGGGCSDDQGLDQNAEACENMLRGCIGLDVTAFVLMTLVGLLEATTALLEVLPSTNHEPFSNRQNEKGSSGILSMRDHGLCFDALRMTMVLQDVLRTEETLLRFRSRLSAVLQSDAMAQSIEIMVTNMIDWIQLT